ncbi:hypothetical protein [Jiella mangrovi]|uniref:Uncharacterized protein n=1 Tax=Jiella mangrovi TaxID=2821407 RepID=A0ABS4BF78_9HYPH|nr:hypothetical protein [Jiella mangrovi]MBP0615400.1 hypothetical protein [Jiella mangrovi]
MKYEIGEARANLEYVRDMLDQLKVVSGAKSSAMLVYFLDLAKLEVEDQLARIDGDAGSRRRNVGA